jgi:hypothetical protein
MDRPDLYDSDILAWSERQAAVLRRLGSTGGLPNDLDLDNVVEEIESVGLSQLRAAESFIRLILEHVVKAVSQPDSPAMDHWRIECMARQDDLAVTLSPAMRQRIDMNSLWQRALRRAKPRLEGQGVTLAASLAGPCPVTLDDLLSPTFEFRDVVCRVAQPLIPPTV